MRSSHYAWYSERSSVKLNSKPREGYLRYLEMHQVNSDGIGINIAHREWGENEILRVINAS